MLTPSMYLYECTVEWTYQYTCNYGDVGQSVSHINAVLTYIIYHVVSRAVCEGLPVSTSLRGASGVSGVTYAGYWLPMN